MFLSLRWRLVGALTLVILLTILLSGTLSILATTNRFDLLITDESRQQAQAIAPFLEASYAYRGNWDGLDTVLADNALNVSPLEIFVPYWESDLDWFEIVLNTLQVEEETLLENWADDQSLAEVAQPYQVEPESLVQAIVKAEQVALDEAVREDEVARNDVPALLVELERDATEFVYEIPYADQLDWDVIIADTLGIPEDTFYTLLETQSPRAMAEARNISPKSLIDAVVEAELEAAQQAGIFVDDAAEQNLINEVSFWVTESDEETAIANILIEDTEFIWTDEGIAWLLNTILLGDGQLLITNPAGQVVYDSDKTRRGQSLEQSILDDGISLWDYTQDEPLGAVIVATNPGFYNAQQRAFLWGVSGSLVASGCVAGLIALLVGLVLSQRVLKPVKALTVASRRLADGEQITRLPTHTNDELGQMSDNFNRMAQALEEQKQLRRRLVDDVSHEIKTPLSIIKLELKATTDGIQTPAEMAHRVQDEVDVLESLLNDLTWLVENHNNTFQLALELTDLAKLTQTTVDRWQSKAQTNDLTLQLETPPDLPPTQVDSMRISQALSNLIDNAIHHTPSGGKIAVRLSYTAPPAGQAMLVTTVTDTGAGIAAEDLPHLFNRFYRADRSRDRRTGGRGLGLAIVHQIIELHKGKVWVESQPSQGSTFGYQLPLL